MTIQSFLKASYEEDSRIKGRETFFGARPIHTFAKAKRPARSYDPWGLFRMSCRKYRLTTRTVKPRIQRRGWNFLFSGNRCWGEGLFDKGDQRVLSKCLSVKWII